MIFILRGYSATSSDSAFFETQFDFTQVLHQGKVILIPPRYYTFLPSSNHNLTRQIPFGSLHVHITRKSFKLVYTWSSSSISWSGKTCWTARTSGPVAAPAQHLNLDGHIVLKVNSIHMIGVCRPTVAEYLFCSGIPSLAITLAIVAR